MKLYLIRHAQSANNAQEESRRIPDPGLTELGHQQSEHLAQWMAQQELTDLWCSPFLRSLETTEPIRRLTGLRPNISAMIHEQGGCYGGYPPGPIAGHPGMTADELLEKFPDYNIDPIIDHLGWWAGKPYETFERAALRAAKVVRWINDDLYTQAKKTSPRIAMVIHADFKRLLLAELLKHWGGDFLEVGPMINTGVSILTRKSNGWRLDALNSSGHLPRSLVTPTIDL